MTFFVCSSVNGRSTADETAPAVAAPAPAASPAALSAAVAAAAVAEAAAAGERSLVRKPLRYTTVRAASVKDIRLRGIVTLRPRSSYLQKDNAFPQSVRKYVKHIGK